MMIQPTGVHPQVCENFAFFSIFLHADEIEFHFKIRSYQ